MNKERPVMFMKEREELTRWKVKKINKSRRNKIKGEHIELSDILIDNFFLNKAALLRTLHNNKLRSSEAFWDALNEKVDYEIKLAIQKAKRDAKFIVKSLG